MEEILKSAIDKDFQIRKFSLYGFFKNLKFFEPYLLIYLNANGLSLFQIGILLSVREVIVNLFEIPSGIVSDMFGRKKALYLCFIFYILSFVAFFIGGRFAVFLLAMILFGLGEAFRSGSHKAMIYSYLEQHDWQEHKTYVYGKTRSVSLYGSAISSLLGIAIILSIPESKFIFLASTIPYILDFFLIISYPRTLDKSDNIKSKPLKEHFLELKNNIIQNKQLKVILVTTGMFESVLSSIKDYIQPILASLIVVSSIPFLDSLGKEDSIAIILGVIYAILNIFSAAASRNSFRIKEALGGKNALNVLYWAFTVALIILGITVGNAIIVSILFILMNFFQNIRKPIYIDVIDKYMEKSQRATVLSIGSQFKSLFLIFLAPLVGFVADRYGMSVLMFFLAGLLMLGYPILRSKKKQSKPNF